MINDSLILKLKIYFLTIKINKLKLKFKANDKNFKLRRKLLISIGRRRIALDKLNKISECI